MIRVMNEDWKSSTVEVRGRAFRRRVRFLLLSASAMVQWSSEESGTDRTEERTDDKLSESRRDDPLSSLAVKVLHVERAPRSESRAAVERARRGTSLTRRKVSGLSPTGRGEERQLTRARLPRGGNPKVILARTRRWCREEQAVEWRRRARERVRVRESESSQLSVKAGGRRSYGGGLSGASCQYALVCTWQWSALSSSEDGHVRPCPLPHSTSHLPATAFCLLFSKAPRTD
jgi:hypothetical protein